MSDWILIEEAPATGEWVLGFGHRDAAEAATGTNAEFHVTRFFDGKFSSKFGWYRSGYDGRDERWEPTHFIKIPPTPDEDHE